MDVDRTDPSVGETVSFTVTATDRGPSDASGVVVQDALPPGLTLMSASPSQGTYDPGTGTWAVGAIAVSASAQISWFQASLLERPDVKKAMQSIDDRSTAIVDEWIRLVEMPAPSKKEQSRAQYIRAEMEKLGLTDIRVDDMSNVSGVRKGSGGGPTGCAAPRGCGRRLDLCRWRAPYRSQPVAHHGAHGRLCGDRGHGIPLHRQRYDLAEFPQGASLESSCVSAKERFVTRIELLRSSRSG